MTVGPTVGDRKRKGTGRAPSGDASVRLRERGIEIVIGTRTTTEGGGSAVEAAKETPADGTGVAETMTGVVARVETMGKIEIGGERRIEIMVRGDELIADGKRD